MSKIHETFYKSPIGWVRIVGVDHGIVSLGFFDEGPPAVFSIPPSIKECVEELDGYFKGKLREFSIALDIDGTDFQKTVWAQVLRIPFGRTSSYKGIAAQIGKPKAVRAVGNANGRNKIPIIIPCHRVVGSSGNLTGYGGGLWRKEWLLNHEQKFSPNSGNEDTGQ